MGQESESNERKKIFKDFRIDGRNIQLARRDVIVLHCLPAHREEEITEEVFENHAAEIFDEAENRLHAQKAVLLKLMG